MSDVIRPTMKVSREGIVLIKSFEGFRPRAIRREDGGWVIGYGHTLSAREGASVSEADAELLLRYDLLPVEKTVNRASPPALNQHQFDAIVSFTYSIGVDGFETSDVRDHLASGATAAAADALIGWPEAPLPQDSLRRRAAERALFVADPDAPVSVSDLLVAPLAPPEGLVSDMAVEPEPILNAVPVEPLATFDQAPPAREAPRDTAPHPRVAAVLALLGEEEPAPVIDAEPPLSVFNMAAAVQHAIEPAPPAANDAHEHPISVAAVDHPAEPDVPAESEPSDAPVTPAIDAPEPSLELAEPVVDPDPVAVTATVQPQASVDAAALAIKRYSPYAATMFGPIPFLSPAGDRVTLTPPTAAPEPEAAIAFEALPAAEPSAAADAPVIRPFEPTMEVDALVLSANEDAPAPALTREPWTPEERPEPYEQTDGGLFGEDLSLTQGGAPIMRHGDIEVGAPASFDWSETGAFIIMGAVGLTAFGAAMAAFRLASEQSGGDETAIIAWILAIIGGACVGVSSFNLYRRWGLPGGDN